MVQNDFPYLCIIPQSFFHNLFFTIFHNLSVTIFLLQSFFHNLSFTLFLLQYFFPNLFFTIFLSQSFLRNLSFIIFSLETVEKPGQTFSMKSNLRRENAKYVIDSCLSFGFLVAPCFRFLLFRFTDLSELLGCKIGFLRQYLLAPALRVKMWFGAGLQIIFQCLQFQAQ